MKYILEIEVPTQATDSNRILGVNKYAKHTIFQRVKRDVAVLVHGRAPAQPLENFRLSIVRYGAKTLDYDNLIASFKPYIDGLKKSEIIKDDSWKYIKQINTNQIISEERKLVIRIEECE